MIFLDYYYQILSFLFLFLCIYFIIQHFKIKKSTLSESDIIILNHIIDSITLNYKNSYFSQRYQQLLNTYDLDQFSPTKATKKFEKDYDDLLKQSAKNVYTDYLSKNIKKLYLKYFTIDALLLQIISNLRNN